MAARWMVPKTTNKDEHDSGVLRVVDFTNLKFNPAIIMIISSPKTSEHLYLTFEQTTEECGLPENRINNYQNTDFLCYSSAGSN
jgi:hypothetical protein